MADVFLATRRGPAGFAKLVVIKRLREDLASLTEGPSYRGLLLDEAKLAARLQHPNIVQTFEVGESAGLPYLAMEYLDGQPLDRVLMAAQRAYVVVPVEILLRLVADVLAGLEYAHDLCDYDGTPLGIVHRDVSPHNVFWTYQGEIKLVDFGVAKYAHSSAETDAGLVKGKLTYMAPEQALRSGLDRRADLFPVGILLWECLAGRPMMPRNNPAAALKKLLYDALPSLAEARPDLDPAIAAICDRALERDPALRYQSAGEMRAELERVIERLCGDRGPQRAELSRFVQRLFEAERAQVARQIKDAMKDGGEGSEDIVDLALDPRGPSSTAALSASGSRPTVSTVHARPSVQPLPALGAGGVPILPPLVSLPPTAVSRHPSQRTRRLLLGILASAAVLVAIAVGVKWQRASRAPSPAAAVAPAASSTSTAAAAVVAAPPSAASSVILRLCGSNTVGAELAPALVEDFLSRKGATAVSRVAGGSAEHRLVTATLDGKPIAVDIEARGTATAFEGLAAASCDLGMASRAIDGKEVAQLVSAGLGDLRAPASEHVLALDGIAVIVHPNSPLRSLDRAALRDIFTGKITDWSKIAGAASLRGPIHVLARDAKSGTFDTFKHLVLGKDALVATAKRFAQSDALADAVASDPQAIGFIGLAYVRSAKALAVAEPGAQPMLPTSFTVATEGYMLSRRLYLYSAPQPRSPLVAELISYALSPRGQQMVAKAQFVDLALTLRDEICDERCPRAYAELVAKAQRVSVDFRFRSGSGEADSRAVRDLDRLVGLLHDHPGARLTLLGFSDSVGGSRKNAQLSLDRARAIAAELATRGVRVAAVKGLGSAMPVASNDSDTGRERNRRVEVWLSK